MSIRWACKDQLKIYHQSGKTKCDNPSNNVSFEIAAGSQSTNSCRCNPNLWMHLFLKTIIQSFWHPLEVLLHLSRPLLGFLQYVLCSFCRFAVLLAWGAQCACIRLRKTRHWNFGPCALCVLKIFATCSVISYTLVRVGLVLYDSLAALARRNYSWETICLPLHLTSFPTDF